MSIRTCGVLSAFLLLGVAISPLQARQDENQRETVPFSVWGVDLAVEDIDQAVAFYTGVMGFSQDESSDSDSSPVLDNGGMKLIFHLTDKPPARKTLSHLSINLSVSDLQKAMTSAIDAGAVVPDPVATTSFEGSFVKVLDPWGNSVNFINPSDPALRNEGPPRLHTIGLHEINFPGIDRFYTLLGFEIDKKEHALTIRTMKKKGSASLVLYIDSLKRRSYTYRQTALVLVAEEPYSKVREQLRAIGMKMPDAQGDTSSEDHEITLHDISGIMVRIVPTP